MVAPCVSTDSGSGRVHIQPGILVGRYSKEFPVVDGPNFVRNTSLRISTRYLACAFLCRVRARKKVEGSEPASEKDVDDVWLQKILGHGDRITETL